MGYSVAVAPRGRRMKERMEAFLSSYFRSYSDVVGVEDDFIRGPTDDLSYDDNRTHLGFDYSPSWDVERNYVWAMARWMALRIGRQRTFDVFEVKGSVRAKMSYVIYDGSEVCPIRLASDWADKVPSECVDIRMPMLVDETGWVVSDYFLTKVEHLRALSPDYDLHVARARLEMKRLSEAWEEWS